MPKTSPRQIMKIIEKIDKAIWSEYKSYQMVKTYILKWQEPIWDAGNTGWNGYNGINFEIVYKDEKEENINLIATLHNMDDELLFKIAFKSCSKNYYVQMIRFQTHTLDVFY